MKATLFLALGICFANATASAQEVRNSVLGTEITAAPARLGKAEAFVAAGGATVTAAETVIVTVEVRDLTPFLPRGAEPPLFVVDGVVAKELVSPLISGRAVLLAPAPESGEAVTLSLLPSGLDLATIRTLPRGELAKMAAQDPDLRRVVPATTDPVLAEGIDELRARLLSNRGRVAP